MGDKLTNSSTDLKYAPIESILRLPLNFRHGREYINIINRRNIFLIELERGIDSLSSEQKRGDAFKQFERVLSIKKYRGVTKFNNLIEILEHRYFL